LSGTGGDSGVFGVASPSLLVGEAGLLISPGFNASGEQETGDDVSGAHDVSGPHDVSGAHDVSGPHETFDTGILEEDGPGGTQDGNPWDEEATKGVVGAEPEDVGGLLPEVGDSFLASVV